jgi:hypothetical protein
MNLRHDIYPVRGRKRSDIGAGLADRATSPRYLPRKGTENVIINVVLHAFVTSPRYLPRKGTETSLL